MEYQKITNLLNNESNKPSKFRTKNWVEINDDIRGVYSPNKQIRFKTSILRSSLCDYSDAYILVKGNITVTNTAGAGVAANNPPGMRRHSDASLWSHLGSDVADHIETSSRRRY